MSARRLKSMILVWVCLASTAVSLRASGPVSVYAIVEKVVLEPNDNEPDRIQIWGVFSVDHGKYQPAYSKPEHGYLYYKTSGNRRAGDRAAWADLKRVAGTGQAVAFGGSFGTETGGKGRKATQKPSSPDTYPSGNPVVMLGPAQTAIVGQLKAALPAK